MLALLLGVGTAFDAPARQSFVIEMVGADDLTNAVGLNSASFNLARIIGPALAGLLIAPRRRHRRPPAGSSSSTRSATSRRSSLAARAMRGADLQPAPPAQRGQGQMREGSATSRAGPT